MSKEQDERLKQMYERTLPPKGTLEYEAIKRAFKNKKTPEIEAYTKKQLEVFHATRFAISGNGLGYPIDALLRYYVHEFNHRAATAGLYSMPTSFGFMEAFMTYMKPLYVFLPKPEINTLCSFVDFLDWTTSFDQTPDKEKLISSIKNQHAYLFSNTSNPDNLKFACTNGIQISLLSAAVIRDRTEMVVVLQIAESEAGEDIEIDMLAAKQRLKELMPFWAKQKEGLEVSSELVHGRVKPKGHIAGYESIAMIRYDIEQHAIVDRALYQDWGDVYSAYVDVVHVFGSKDSSSLSPEQKKLFEASIAKCDQYQEVFELCRHFALLPHFAASYVEHTKQYDHPTELKSVSDGIKAKKLLEKAIDETKVFVRRVNKIEVPKNTNTGEIIIKVPEYGYEDSGYWQALAPWEQGVDRLGLLEQGRTWIKQARPVRPGKQHHELKPTSISSTQSADRSRSTFGYIYVMRSAQHEKDVFKIGLTTRDTRTRAKELTSHTSSLDQFGVMQEWEVSDCHKAENAIHKQLEAFRINKKREFFKCEYRQIFSVVHQVVEAVNSSN